MKVSTQKSFRNLHTWTGLLTGLLLLIAFYAGAISVFVHELQQWHGAVQQRECSKPDLGAHSEREHRVVVTEALHRHRKLQVLQTMRLSRGREQPA